LPVVPVFFTATGVIHQKLTPSGGGNGGKGGGVIISHTWRTEHTRTENEKKKKRFKFAFSVKHVERKSRVVVGTGRNHSSHHRKTVLLLRKVNYKHALVN
jgi:hypothetical protein